MNGKRAKLIRRLAKHKERPGDLEHFARLVEENNRHIKKPKGRDKRQGVEIKSVYLGVKPKLKIIR